MSDIEFSGTDSEPVSDVNPEEMARLMAVSVLSCKVQEEPGRHSGQIVYFFIHVCSSILGKIGMQRGRKSEAEFWKI